MLSLSRGLHSCCLRRLSLYSTFASGVYAFIYVFALAYALATGAAGLSVWYGKHSNQQLKKEFPVPIVYPLSEKGSALRSTGYRSMADTPSKGFGSLSDDKDAGSTISIYSNAGE
ncbi:hypothetical protein OPV22_013983 [Ensete ventricosum]|uniref:Uncharacterized protein n=1 Tax=Ensete ventricosum TaxID=4639 RepID=A0AAV8QWT4_ENSVE|nr:hypothetical protein OPV22_013983 [Ensete ventricosum]